MEVKIKIASDFSIFPGSRYPEEGEFSGQEFREKILAPKFKEALGSKAKLKIDLDGTLGYGTSFLEEVFGGLAREYGADIVKKTIEIISKDEEYLADDIKQYIEDAKE